MRVICHIFHLLAVRTLLIFDTESSVYYKTWVFFFIKDNKFSLISYIDLLKGSLDHHCSKFIVFRFFKKMYEFYRFEAKMGQIKLKVN